MRLAIGPHLEEGRFLRTGLAAGEATDVVWALTSYDMYRALVGEQHWPAGRYQNWLADTMATCLLDT